MLIQAPWRRVKLTVLSVKERGELALNQAGLEPFSEWLKP
ncbi:hypothetical protein AcetOrient_orf04650 [Acetobacter orientalis]|uniref:Uncharacterized protein n=1 Tax=Acetobacter orientalis TaxID=146474 RepID=A0A2Z5ZLW6_9PROT|nr:hypothetical protein AcetOrient_orf04650 [Acetobacter orientalis]